MACFWIIIQLLIRLLAFFGFTAEKYHLEFESKLKIESTDIVMKLGKDYFNSISSHIE